MLREEVEARALDDSQPDFITGNVANLPDELDLAALTSSDVAVGEIAP